MTTEIAEGTQEARGRFTSFIGDMVIKLDTMFIRDEFKRVLSVTKMRRSKHTQFIHPYIIGKDGLEVTKL